MWLHGDVPAWGINLHSRTATLYRAIRKNHHGWPVAWTAFARSGEPELLKYAEAATRQMIDANFNHFATEEVDQAVGEDHFRRQGWWDRSLLPWAGRTGPHLRSYTVDTDYVWHAYYLTGYTRARDVALLFGHLTQRDYESVRGPRATSSMMPSYLDMYNATFDPWYLVAARQIADLHVRLDGRVHQEPAVEGKVDKITPITVGHFWRPADLIMHRYTGHESYHRLAYNHSLSLSSPWSYTYGGLWPRLSMPAIAQAAYAYELKEDPFHLARAAAYLDWARFGVYEGDVEYGRGSIVQGGTARGIFTGYYVKQFPKALAAFERAGYRPDPIPNPFYVRGSELPGDESVYEFQLPEVVFRTAGQEAMPLLLASHGQVGNQEYTYRIIAPDGQELMAGNWPRGEHRGNMWRQTIDLPRGAPRGDYRLHLGGKVPFDDDSVEGRARTRRRHGAVALPATPPDVPEVTVFERRDDGIGVASGGPEIQYWFKVPEDVRTFWIEFAAGGGDFNRVSVWNPEGERVWDLSYSSVEQGPRRVRIAVPSEHAGTLWRATGSHFVIDPQIPPYFSASRTKWFRPEQ